MVDIGGIPSDPGSPDELSGATTVGKHAVKRSDSHKIDLARHLQNAEGQIGNQRLGSAGPVKDITQAIRVVTETPPAWAIDISKVMVPRDQDVVAQHRDLGLQYDEAEESYILIYNGTNLIRTGISGHVHCRKIQKVFHAFDGLQVRLQSSLEEGTDNKLDLVLKNRNDLIKFLDHLKDKVNLVRFRENSRYKLLLCEFKSNY